MKSNKQFETLSNRVIGMPAEMLLNCFISGLKKEIQHELFILKPYSFSHTIGLAKQLEAKLTALKPFQPKFPRPTPPTSI